MSQTPVLSKADFTEYIQQFRFRELFNYLGWDNDRTAIPPIAEDDHVFSPQSIARKSGFRVIVCENDEIPSHPVCIKVASKLKKLFDKHLLIFTDKKEGQLWLYRKAMLRYRASQSIEQLYQRTSGLIFELDEQDNITIIDVERRVDENFAANAEKVTKRFYDAFKKQHDALIKMISGIEVMADREWYASIMLNRLMFCYFMQRKGFLNDDKNYLRNKLSESKNQLGEGEVYSFYRGFLLKLFQQGLGAFERSVEIEDMIGKIPYLNGGLFDLHVIERAYPEIDITDDAFERIFDLFDRYEWHLDTRECKTGNEINPDVLGYIFEKYINDRSAMGAYYTQEDITEYIGRSTILPYLLDCVKVACPAAFEPDGAVWAFLREGGTEFIFDSVKHGIDIDKELPAHISVGIDTSKPDLIERRQRWNEPAPPEFALPTETWREVIGRRSRCQAVMNLIEDGDVTDIADLITHNLDIVSFVNELLNSIEDPVFVEAFYDSLTKITILDQTCGSGAFLFAAINILEPLYANCLLRMEDYMEHDYKGILQRGIRRKFDAWLEDVEKHPNKQYFIYKSIILNNLYGVDIMREAVETAKLRLFLKLVSTADPNYRADNIGIEPLPDIDFNIKAGNTLIGYANEEEVDTALHSTMEGVLRAGEIKDAMFQLAKTTARYKDLQLSIGSHETAGLREAKAEVLEHQAHLRATLDSALHKSPHYEGVSDEGWQTRHMPFHWVSEFYSIIVDNKGFDVIIGNPPYVNYVPDKLGYHLYGYEAVTRGNIYGHCIERSTHLCRPQAYISMICPMSLVKMPTYEQLRKLLNSTTTYYAVFSADSHPGTLFDGVQQNLTIFVRTGVAGNTTYSTRFIRFSADERASLLKNLQFAKKTLDNIVGNELEVNIFSKLRRLRPVNYSFAVSKHSVCMKNTSGAQFKVFFDTPPFFEVNSAQQTPTTLQFISFASENDKQAALSLYNSCLFNLWWCSLSDGRHIVSREYGTMPMFDLDDTVVSEMTELNEALRVSLQTNAKRVVYNKANGVTEYDQYFPRYSKPIIDQIDTLLARHYGFTEEELDYIINYDIKYRMGISGEADDYE